MVPVRSATSIHALSAVRLYRRSYVAIVDPAVTRLHPGQHSGCVEIAAVTVGAAGVSGADSSPTVTPSLSSSVVSSVDPAAGRKLTQAAELEGVPEIDVGSIGEGV